MVQVGREQYTMRIIESVEDTDDGLVVNDVVKDC